MAQNKELTIVFIGSPQKEALFEKMKSVAVRFEKHVTYQDTYYLTYIVDGSEAIIELVDPGLEHTGAREMSIRKAHGAILFYQASSLASFNQLYDVAHDFQMRKSKMKPPVILIGNEDDIVHADEECPESTSTSASEGYESDPIHPLTVENRSRGSMELIRQSHDDARVTQLQGQRMADLFGLRCKFLSLTISNYDGTLKMMEELVRTIRSQNEQKRKNLLERLKKVHDGKAAKKVKTAVNSKTCSVM